MEKIIDFITDNFDSIKEEVLSNQKSTTIDEVIYNVILENNA